MQPRAREQAGQAVRGQDGRPRCGLFLAGMSCAGVCRPRLVVQKRDSRCLGDRLGGCCVASAQAWTVCLEPRGGRRHLPGQQGSQVGEMLRLS